MYCVSEQLLLLKVSIQLLGNCSVNNKTVQPIIWRLCYSELFRYFFVSIVYYYMTIVSCFFFQFAPVRHRFRCSKLYVYDNSCLYRKYLRTKVNINYFQTLYKLIHGLLMYDYKIINPTHNYIRMEDKPKRH